jgi:hypothetical protein
MKWLLLVVNKKRMNILPRIGNAWGEFCVGMDSMIQRRSPPVKVQHRTTNSPHSDFREPGYAVRTNLPTPPKASPEILGLGGLMVELGANRGVRESQLFGPSRSVTGLFPPFLCGREGLQWIARARYKADTS